MKCPAFLSRSRVRLTRKSFRPLALTSLAWILSACGHAGGGPAVPSAGAPANQGGPSSGTRQIALTPQAARAIGNKIWQNECGGTVSGLTSWNEGEYFASLGIGHFIWYVPGQRGPFEESFPPLISYMQQQNVRVPAWIVAAPGCPWRNRADFLAAQDSPKMQELRQFLAGTVEVQTAFIVRRLEQALPKMLAATPAPEDQARLRATFQAVSESPQGIYALIDYVNFKGEGVNPAERYQGQGWGLRDVLLEMRGQPRGAAAAYEFGEAARRVLERRVRNAPPERNESRWLPGWTNRAASYQKPL